MLQKCTKMCITNVSTKQRGSMRLTGKRSEYWTDEVKLQPESHLDQ